LRVHELAKELGLSSKELLAQLHDLGVEAKTHMSAVSETAIGLLREHVSAPASEQPAEPKAVEPEPPPEKTPEGPAEEPPAEEAAAPAPEPGAAIAAEGKAIRVRGAVIVKDFADALGMPPNKVIAELMGMNILASINERVDVKTAKTIAEKHGFTFEHQKRAAEHVVPKKPEEEELEEEEDRPEDLLPRAPVVTFLGHVDHGKTSLLDRIRNTTVVDGEFGGITQHIGAYTVTMGGRSITFLDTPGHEAFTAMRARGANLTDIAVIIIAADDGIMPQTEEAIMHARAAEVAIVVAINKIDLPTANVERVKQQLQQMEMTPDDWGGDIVCCSVSAQTGEGIDHLLEMILLQADMLELKANANRRASGFVIEARLEPGMGPTCTLLVKKGTFKVGDAVLCEQHWGRVRALINDHGVKVNSAGPSTPVKCLGLSGVPEAGARFTVCASDRIARSHAAQAEQRLKGDQVAAPRRASLDDLYEQIKKSEALELKLIVKADTQGSIEAISHALKDIQSDKITLNILLGATGNITINDVLLASASDGIVLGFHVAKESGVDARSKHEGVEIRLHSVIYELLDQVREAMTGLLPTQTQERAMGVAEVKQVFGMGKQVKVAGCLCTSGSITPRYRARLKRADEILFEGSIDSLRHFQDDVAEIRQSQECGVRLANFTDFEEGDILEFYQLEEIEQTL